MTSYKRGEVVLVTFPNSDLITYKRRPALVVQADDLDAGVAQTVLALITSNQSRSGHPSRISIAQNTPEARQAGLRTNSVIMTDDLTTVANHLIGRVIGTIPDMAAIDAAMRHTLCL